MNVLTNEFPLWVFIPLLLFFVVMLLLARKMLVRADAGQAIIRTGTGPRVIGTQGIMFAMPLMHTCQFLSLGRRQVQLDTRNDEHYRSRDGHHYQAVLTLQFTIAPDKSQIAQLLENYSVDQLNDPGTLANLLLPPFGESLQRIIKEHTVQELFNNPEAIKSALEVAMLKPLRGLRDPEITIEYMGPVPDVLRAAANQT